MTLPTLLFAFILSTLYGAGFHLWQGGGARRLLLYLLAGWLGFALGHFVGEWLGLRLLAVGALNTFTATLGSVVALFAARLLALNESVEASK
jgi:uncharacterized membrane protein YeaQ/YmgE (transglycosylase-associated protein family)